jgi:dephospho-CoA kinase
MSIIALTGGIGSGKSEAAHLFAALGVPIVDTDIISHQLTAPNQPATNQIKALFGVDFINTEGALDRAKMRTFVFKSPEARLKLEQLLHPMIRAEALKQLQENTSKMQANPEKNSDVISSNYQIIVVPLLFESNQYAKIAKLNLVIDCDPQRQIARTMARSHMTEEHVRAIMQAQVSREVRLSQADEVIENNGTIEELTHKVYDTHKKLCKVCLKLA